VTLTSLINRPCVLRHRTGGTMVDRDGNEIAEWVEVATVCEIQQRRRTENNEQISVAQWVAFLLPGETVRTGDELVVDDITYQIEGDPWPARNPRTRQASHIEATLRRMAGALD